jgi:hypothetical protein
VNCPIVTIIAVNHDGCSRLGRLIDDFIDSVLGSEFQSDYELIIVDNGSHDDSVRHINRAFRSKRQFRVLELAENVGFPQACNLGAAAANPNSRYLAFLNNDVIVERGWLREIIGVMASNEMIGVAGALLLEMDEQSKVQNCGAICDRLCQTVEIGVGVDSSTIHSKVVEVGYVSGACLVTPTRVFRESGGFDGSFFMYCDDIDYCLKVRGLGYQCVVVTSAHVWHLGRGTSRQGSRARSYLNVRMAPTLGRAYRNQMRVNARYQPHSRGLIVAFLLLGLRNLRNFVYHCFVTKDLAPGFAFLSAIWWTIGRIRVLVCDRHMYKRFRVMHLLVDEPKLARLSAVSMLAVWPNLHARLLTLRSNLATKMVLRKD